MEKPSENPDVARKVSGIHTLLASSLREGKLIFNQPMSFDITNASEDGVSYMVKIDDYKDLEGKYLDAFDDPDFSLEGSCLVLVPVLAGILKHKELIDDFEYIVDDEIHHTAFIATIEGQRFLVDFARRKPIPHVIPINEAEVKSDFYQSPISYQATEEEGQLTLRIKDPARTDKPDRRITFRKMGDREEHIKNAEKALAYHKRLTEAVYSADTFEIKELNTLASQLRFAVQKALEDKEPPVFFVYGGEEVRRVN